MGTLKDLIKYFYEYPIEFFPVVEKNNKIKGFILKKSSLKDVNDIERLKLDLKDFLCENTQLLENFYSKEEFMKKLEPLKKFPIISYESGEFEIVDFKNFKEKYLRKDTIDYKNALLKSRIGIIIYDLYETVLFKNEYFNIIEQQSDNFETKEFIHDIIVNLNKDDETTEGSINIDYDGVEIEYSVFSYIDKDKEEKDVIISSFVPKTTSIVKEKNEILNQTIENSREETEEEKIQKYIKCEIINLMNNENFSMKNYLKEKEDFLIKTLIEVLDNNSSLISKVLKIDKEEVEFKIKTIKFID